MPRAMISRTHSSQWNLSVAGVGPFTSSALTKTPPGLSAAKMRWKSAALSSSVRWWIDSAETIASKEPGMGSRE
jgi:hypothetical protein